MAVGYAFNLKSALVMWVTVTQEIKLVKFLWCDPDMLPN
ncbi:hypothetical protein Cal7507_2338 [Calothrix sp. PCC 7507]|nr:hypothetical protein Cal7507_2338 [Calothrix sp. PCC 7507]